MCISSSHFVVYFDDKTCRDDNADKKDASSISGAIGIPGAVIGILTGGFLLKRFQLKPKGKQFVKCLGSGQNNAQVLPGFDPDIRWLPPALSEVLFVFVDNVNDWLMIDNLVYTTHGQLN